MDTIIERAGVVKMTLYQHVPSKDDLVLAFLQRREQVWTHDWLELEVKRRGFGSLAGEVRSAVTASTETPASAPRRPRVSRLEADREQPVSLALEIAGLRWWR